MPSRGGLCYSLLGFHSIGEYGRSLVRTPQRLATRFFMRRSFADQQYDKGREGDMKVVLGPLDLVCLGVGLMLGAGVFVTTGTVAVEDAGPGVVVSYAVAGLSALLSSLCYAEFAVNLPMCGGAYSYISAVFGEYLAWITVTNLILEYILANAAIVRGYAPYMAMLCNKDSSFFWMQWNGYVIDWWAFGICIVLTGLLMIGTKESSTFNVILTIVHVLLVAFIVVAGLVKSNPANAQPFFPYEVRGVFNGAAIVFFSYIGFDAVATSAEEVRRPGRDLPLGILGALFIVTTCYMLMSAALVMMVPLDKIDLGAPFAAAFEYVGLRWAKYIVALGALMGIVTSTLVGMFAVSRIIAAVARTHLLPPFLAKVSNRWGTPWIATLLQGVATALIALFTGFDDLVDMVSISTLFAFWIVALGLIWFRGYERGVTSHAKGALLGGHMILLIACALAFTIVYQLVDGWIGLVVTAAVAIATTASMHLLCRKQFRKAQGYGVPLFPWVPAASMFLNTFLLGQLNVHAYERFGIWSAVVTLVYILYSIHGATVLDDNRSNTLPEKVNEAELVEPYGMPDRAAKPAAAAAQASD